MKLSPLIAYLYNDIPFVFTIKTNILNLIKILDVGSLSGSSLYLLGPPFGGRRVKGRSTTQPYSKVQRDYFLEHPELLDKILKTSKKHFERCGNKILKH